jgi:hypothetical protein
MYLLSNILKAPSPPHNLFPASRNEGIATEDVDVKSRVGEAVTEGCVEERTEALSNMES